MSLLKKKNYSKLLSSILIAFLLTNISFLFVSIEPTSASPGFTLKWVTKLGQYAKTGVGALAADVNGDGKLEIIVTGGSTDGGTDGTVTALDTTTGNIIWQVSPGGIGSHSPCEIADINKDGILEIVVSGNNPVVLFGNNGSTYWKNTAVSSYNLYSPVCDIDADGYSEIFVSSGGGPEQGYDYVSELSYNGEVLRQNPTSWHPCYGGMTIGDANSDGRFELYQGDRNYGYSTTDPYTYGEWGVRCFDAHTLTPLWNDSSILCSSHTPMLADVDKDGILDVIVAHQGTGDGGLAVYRAVDGTVSTSGGKYRKGLSLGLPSHSQPTVYDIDGDGNLEIITCRDTNPKIWDLYEWKLDATLPIVCWEPPEVGDVTGDGKMDIIAVNGSNIVIYSYNPSDRSYYEVDNISGLYDASAHTLLEDVDGDGLNELILTSYGWRGGYVYCYDTSAPAPTPRVRKGVQFYSERHLGAAEYLPPPATPAPAISDPTPLDGATNVPIALLQLSFTLTDYQHDLIDYTMTTSPNIGSGSGTNKVNGQYSISVSNLNYATTYTWTVTATDGQNPRTRTFTFATQLLPPWWNTAWPYRRTITIDHTKVSGDQTDFPVVIDLVDGGLASKAQLDGDDFVFTDANQVKLSHEIEKYDAATGHLTVWVKVPFLSASVDTNVIMYYGNPTCGNQQNPTVVWDTNNMLVLHLDETHECRMWGMIANTLPHDVVLNNLISAPSSLKVLGGSNRDGWGLVYYSGTTPVVTRGPQPANTDPNFDLAANALADSNAWVGVGHVRARSQGGLPPWGDPHPFMRYKGGKWWAFAHNGNVNKGILRNLIGPAYLAVNPPTYGASWDDDSNIVDSDLYSLWVLKCIEANNWDVTLGVAQAIKEMTDAGDSGAANFLLTNGETLWGFRRGNTLYYYYQATSPQYSTIVSQPPDTSLPGWVQLNDYNFITVTKSSPPAIIADIRQKYPSPLLVDSEFSISVDSADLRNNGTGQDWYESRNDLQTLLFLDTNNVGSDASKKAGFTANDTKNAYLTQEFSSPQTGTFTAQWDIYVVSILNISSPDRAGIMLIGSDLDGQKGPSSADSERFVFLAFYKDGGGTSGTMDLVAMSNFNTYTTVASGLSMKQWYTIRVEVNVTAGTYDIYLDGVYKATKNAVTKLTSLTHISFAQWNDGAGAFYADNVYSPARNRYKLAIDISGSGSVTGNPAEASYLPATNVTLTATPTTGWVFSGWSGDLTGSTNPTTIIIDTNKVVGAIFTSQGYSLTVNVVGSGSVSKSPDQGAYTEGSVVTLTAAPVLGWSFSGWSGDLSGSTNPTTITMSGNKVVTATFTQNQYTLTVNKVGSGLVTKNPDKATYIYGETITLTASGDPGWLFSSWSGDLTGSNNPASITMDSNKVVTATFIQGYALTVNVVGSGSVAKSPDQGSYTEGSVVTLTAAPALGWSFSGWSGDLTGNDNPVTITISADKSVTATFTQNQYTLTVTIVGGGSVAKNPDKATYTYGEAVTLTATPEPGWAFSSFSCGCDNPFTMIIDSDKVVTATFIQEYTLVVGIVGSGSVSKSPDQAAYTEGSVVTLTAAPALGWSFSGWSGDLSGSTNPTTITMTSNKVVTATFTSNQYTLIVSIVGSGSVVKNPSKSTYNYGETVALTASPSVGWSFFRWSGDLSGNANPATITIDGNKVVTATFVQGTVCFDSTTNGNNGVLYGGVTQGVLGRMDGAYGFDGTTGYVEVPHNDALAGFTQGFTQGFTTSFWLKLEDVSRRQTILSKYDATGTNQKGWFVEYQNHATYGKVLGFFASQDGNTYKEWYASFNPTAGAWYYITVVWQTSVIPKFYVNGIQIATKNSGTIASIYNNAGIPLHIGRCTYNTARYLKGSLDEIRVSNTVRTAGWTLTCCNNQKDPSVFYSLGKEESLPPAPFISDPNPANKATNVPVTSTELSFSLNDYQNDAMNYAVSTTPDVGGGSANGVHNGRYSVIVSGLQYSTTYTWQVHVTDGTHETDATYTFTTAPRWLVDSEFSDSVDSADLKNNGTGQDWYESRNDVPTLLFLDTNNIGGDASKKAGFTASSSGNAYLTQEFSIPQTGTFTAQWDIFVDSILDISSPDRAGFMLIGADLDGQKGPSSADSERFVFLSFFKNGGGTSGTMDLVAMSNFNTYTTVASSLDMKRWYTIRVAVNVPAGTYDIYVDGVLKATENAVTKLTSLTHISFAQWNDGAGAFFVDNVFSPAQDRYRLTMSTVGSGSIAKSPAEATYTQGTVVTLTATPSSGWYFDGWSGDISGNTNPTTITVTGNKVVAATFTQGYSLTVNTVGSGSVAKNPDQATYTPGSLVTLTATPATGWFFGGWSGDLTGSANPASITLTSSKVVTATFTQKQYTLTVNLVGSGSVTKNPDQANYTEGSIVTLTAAPALGWSFSGWSGDLTGTANPTTITVTGNKVVSATFAQNQYTLTLNIDGGGSVVKTPDQPTYTYGTLVQLTAVPEPGYAFSHWTGDLSGNLSQDSISMTGNKAVTAVFIWTQTNWWNSAWQYRRTITINHQKVSSDQTNFPVLIDLTDSGLTLKAQADGDDFVFVSADNVKLSHEIELYNISTGRLVAWVKVPNLSSTIDTTIYIYYGNPTCSSQQDKTAVWDANYKAILHLNENTGTHFDSTPNHNDGTPFSPINQGTTGKIDGCDEFTGGYVGLPRVCSSETQFTFSAWIYPRIGARYFISEWTNNQGAFLQISGDSVVQFYVNGLMVEKSVSLNQWHYVVGTFDGTTARLSVDGGSPSSKSTSPPTWPTQSMYVGDRSDHLRKFSGFIDEVRVSNMARSSGWIITEYNNQKDPSTFYQIGTEEHVEVPRYTLTITIVGQGSVTKNPDQITYLKDTVVQLTANAVLGWTFSGWSGDLTGSTNPISITMTGNKAVTATFTRDQYTLTLTVVGDGQITKNPDQTTYTYGTIVTLTAAPSAGWSFSGWSGDLSGSTSPTTITMTGNKVVTATFTQLEYTLAVTAAPLEGGSVSVSPLGPYHYGDVVQLTAVPTTDWYFAGWSGDLSGSTSPTTITMDGNKAVTATFIKVGYTLTINVVGSGSVTISPEQPTYTPGSVVTLTAVHAVGWSFSGWSGDLTGTANPSTVTMDSNKSITATFTQDQYTLSITLDGNGQVTKSPDQATYTYGTIVTLTATADLGWTFSGWSGDLSGSTSPTTITMDGNKAVTAKFTANQYTLTVNVVGSGSASKSPDQPTFTYNTVVTLTATPQAGWLFSQWSGDLTGSTNPGTITITGNKVVTATFIRLLVDSEFTDSVDSADLRANSTSQDWYESRQNVPTLLFLDTNDIAGNTGKKAGFTGSTGGNAYLSQEFISPQTGTFSVQWDIYVASIIDISGTDATGWMMIGDDSTPASPGPNYPTAERFVYMAFYKNGGGTSGTMALVCRQRGTDTLTTIATLNMLQWYTIKVVINVAGGTYDVYVDGTLMGTYTSRNAKTSVTHISFAQWNDGAGAFYVDNVHSPALDRYKLTVGTVGSGSVTKNPGESTYATGSVVTLTATPASGWAFSAWSGGLSGSANPATVTMDSAKTITATFAQNQYTLAVNVAGSGIVTKSPDKTTYNDGEIVTLTAVPSAGWSFTAWSGDLSGNTNPTTITMTGNKGVTATFTQLEYTLTATASPSEGGSVTVSPLGPYHYSDLVQLTAVPATDWSFSGWGGDLTGSENPATITITQNTAITAYFSQNERTLTINIVGNGHVTKDPDKATYPDGTVVTLTATADPGWTFTGWSGDLSGSINPTSITMTGNKGVTATFTQNEYTLTVNIVGLGSVTRNPDQLTYHYNDVVQLTAKAADGWIFSGWSGDVSGSTNPDSVTIDVDPSVTATFTQHQYALTVIVVGNGVVNKVPDQASYASGTVVQVTAVPDAGWSFSGWSGALSGSVNPESITMDSDKAVTATFTANQYTLTVTIVGSGLVSQSPDPPYTYGTVVTLTATPQAGWLFSQWTGDLTSSTNPATITITGNKAVTATFVRLLVDSEFTDSVDSAALRANGAGQDWYESRAQAPTLLYLDETNVGGNAGKKAGFTASSTTNAYLTQEFSTPQTGTFTTQWDIYVDTILDISIDRAGFMLIGRSGTSGPNRADADRFVYLAFYKNGGGTSGTMDLVAMSNFNTYTTVASGLNMKQWYTIRVVVNVAAGTYDVYVDGVFKATKNGAAALTSLTYISFAQWNDGAGAFYVDNVFSPAVDRYKLTVNAIGSGSTIGTPGEATYAAGSVVTLTATPASGWTFSGWSSDLSGTNNPESITIDANKAVTATFTQLANYNDVVFDSSFETGNLKNVQFQTGDALGNRFYTGEQDHTTVSGMTDKHWWFYFSMDNVAGKTVTIKLVNNEVADMADRWAEIEPVYSFDNINWERLPLSNVVVDIPGRSFQMTVTLTPAQNKIWLAPLPPYTISLRDALFTEFASSPYLAVTSLDTTPGGQELKVATITDKTYSDANKIKAYVIAMQHSTEVPGGWEADGMIRFLLSSDPTAQAIRRSYIFRIVPIVNVDGVYYGRSRYTPLRDGVQYDLNRWWSYDVSAMPFEVAKIFLDIQAFQPSSFNDLHSTINTEMGSPKDAVTYTWSTSDPTVVAFLNKIHDAGWPDTQRGYSGYACTQVHSRLGVVRSISWENPQDEFITNPGHKLTINDWRDMGKAYAKGVYLDGGDAQAILITNVVGSGSITKSPDQVTYAYGTSVQLIAVPNAGWVFSDWSGDLVSLDNPAAINMNGYKSVTATFTAEGPPLGIEANFDSASIGTYIIQGNQIDFNMVTENLATGESYTYWTYFKVTNTQDKEVTFRITNAASVPFLTTTSYEAQMVYSYDGNTWSRITTHSYSSGIYTFTQTFTSNEAYVATFFPFSYTQMQDYLNTVDASPWAVKTVLGSSEQGRDVSMLLITNPSIPDADKKVIFIIGRQHSAETASSYMLEGMIDFLISDNVDAQRMRDAFVWYIVPMVNPDGVYLGRSRATSDWRNANRDWKNTETAEINMVRAVINVIDGVYGIDFFIDWHSQMDDISWYNFVYSPPGNTFYSILSSNTDFDTQFASTPGTGSLNDCTAREYISWNYIYDPMFVFEPTPHLYTWTIPSLRQQGVNVAYAIDQYTTYNLDVTVVGSGSVTKNPPGPTYAYGTSVQLTAVPNIGWSFSEWSGDLTGNTNPTTITIDGNKAVTATFTQNPQAEYTLTVSIVGSGSVTKDPNQATYVDGTPVTLTASAGVGYVFSGWSGDLSASTNPITITMTSSKTVTATFLQILLVDSNLDASIDSADLRTNGTGQDWYESRGQNANLLTLDTADIGGNSGKKARLTGGTSATTDNIYLTQEFLSPQTGIFSVQWDIYIDQILDISSPDRSGWMLIGDDSTAGSGPNAVNGERFVYMAFFKNGGGTSGSMDLVAVNRTGSFSSHMIVASGLSLKQWYTIKVLVNVTGGNYDVYVDGVFKATVTSRNAKTSLTHISFAQWSDGAGTFYVDNVYSPARSMQAMLASVDSGLTSPTGNYRWMDVANQTYSSSYRTSYNYSQASVTVNYNRVGKTLTGKLVAQNLKPNFAYQFKLAGTPGTADNELIGLAGRWWQEEWDGTAWTNGQNLNDRGTGSSPNPNDDTYLARKSIMDITSPTGLHYRYTGYLLFGYFITDSNGGATLYFETGSCYHVLWQTTQRPRVAEDGTLKTVTFDPVLSAAYDVDYPSSTVSIFGEWERLPMGSVNLAAGNYNCQLVLTEESFHGTGSLEGNWAAAMSTNVSFTIAP